MTIHNFRSDLSDNVFKAIVNYANNLKGGVLIIHSDCTISIYCDDGCICEHYLITLQELIKFM